MIQRILVCILVFLHCVYAENILFDCKITQEIKHNQSEIPESFHPSNNLTRYPDKFFVATGSPILIHGTLVDEACKPISNSLIYIWHTNHYGEYQYKKDSNYKVNRYDPYFTGTGTAKTDNAGNYSFITIFPNSKEGSIHVNFIVSSQYFPVFHTKMPLEESNGQKTKNGNNNNSANSYDPKIYEFNICLAGKNKYYQN